MEDMQRKFDAILNDPQIMQKIMAMAQTLGGPIPQERPEPTTPEPPPAPQSSAGISPPNIDIGMLTQLAGITKQSSIDSNQRALLQALHPYLVAERISKLERAMQAAKIANLASTFLNSRTLQFLQGR